MHSLTGNNHQFVQEFLGRSRNELVGLIIGSGLVSWFRMSIAISVYVLVAIIKKRLGLEEILYTIIQILSLTLFEKAPLKQILRADDYKVEDFINVNQLKLFDKFTEQW